MAGEIYTVNDLMERWKCSRDVLYDLMHSGKLKHFKVGSYYRITREAVERYERGE